MSEPTYTCEMCSRTFESAWSNEEAEAEYAALFGESIEGTAIVCDDCYQKLMAQPITIAA